MNTQVDFPAQLPNKTKLPEEQVKSFSKQPLLLGVQFWTEFESLRQSLICSLVAPFIPTNSPSPLLSVLGGVGKAPILQLLVVVQKPIEQAVVLLEVKVVVSELALLVVVKTEVLILSVFCLSKKTRIF
ncbi:hypothetical protein [endosymbiont GvMRE of Glomus versiforme]|uniref:hypothetical protein n=1 Tax=endosymbiont GvMRE of Glomus versiforme TaxID=2039283 RepID=UPI0011C49C07|nr:hypothetical protein [endosymbiont GvMRE of Glomus versiforme]